MLNRSGATLVLHGAHAPQTKGNLLVIKLKFCHVHQVKSNENAPWLTILHPNAAQTSLQISNLSLHVAIMHQSIFS
jgi:hypothetical protein